MTRRGVISAAVIATLALSAGIVQWQSPAAQAASALFAQTVADARAAALAIENDRSAQPDPDVTPTETPAPDPAPDAIPVGTVTPGEPSTVAAPEVGATVDFSGHGVRAPLDVAVTGLPEAAASAAAETSSVVLAQPFQVTATTPAGDEVTSFPADPTFMNPNSIQPVLLDVTPGVALSIAVPADQLAGIDPTTVRIVTRESDSDPWVELPSFYDAASGAAMAQSDHLSQFAVIGVPFVPPGPRIVLDPDDDVGWTTGPNGYSTELGYNVHLANALAAQLQTLCQAKVFVTRTTTDQPYLSRDFRAAEAAAWNPDATITLAFNAIYGYPWGGDPTEGGTLVWGRGSGADTALRNSLLNTMPSYTSRPAHVGSDPRYPWSEFDGLPGAMVHMETLFIDNTDDRAVLDSPGGWEAVTNGAATSIGQYAESLGYDCTDPATGGWPALPSAAQIAQWKQLGYHYNQVYSGDPVSLSTGNLLEREPIFTLNGPGSQAVDLTLVYNSQDGRPSRVGTGWSFGLGAKAQRFADGSVLVVRGDGASDVFTPDGAGGYTADADVHNTLVETGAGRLAMTSPTGQKWVFDASDIDGIGELVSYLDLQGNGYTLAYGTPASVTDPSGDPFSGDRFLPLASITDAAGQVITVSTDAKGRITGFTHPDGRTWVLAYGSAGDLASITAPDSRVRSFSYDSAHRMLSATDAAGVQYLVNQYDAQGRVVRQWDADHNLRTYQYSGSAAVGGSTVYTNNEGNPTTYVWDALSRITSITDALGGVERFQYDADGNTSQHTDQVGNVTRYGYDGRGNLISETMPDGSVRTHTYTATGVLTSTTDEGGPGGSARTTSYDVDARGLTTAAHLPDGGTVLFSYTASGDLASVTDQAGKTTGYGYDTVGNLVSVTDPLGQVTAISYDAAGRATSTTDPSGATTAFVWDAGDRLTRSVDALGGVTRYGYDANNHVTSVTDPLGAITGFAWDAMFHLTAVTAPDGGVTRYSYDSEDNLTSVTDPLGAVTTLSLDDLGRTTSVTDAAGSVWRSAYDALGQVTVATDPLGAITQYAYDVMGRPTAVTDPSGAVSRAAYDAVGRLASTTDAVGGTTRYAYTALDQLAAVTDQAGKSTAYHYDSVGNQTATIDRRGQSWASAFDAIGRVTSTTDPTGATTSYAYNTASRQVSMTDPLGNTTTTRLDALGRATSVTDPLGAVTSAVYDAAGHLTQTTDANGAVSRAAYDIAGRAAQLTNALGAVSRLAYDLKGQVVKATDANGVATAYSYDALGQLSQVTGGFHPLPTTATGTDVNDVTKYSYTPTGLLASTTDANGAVTRLQHDSRGLTTAETNPLGITSRTSYDALGRTATSTDGNGATTRYSYTPRSDVASISYPDGVNVGFEYDANQNPIVMTDGLGATGWSYDRAGRMVSQTDPNAATVGWGYNAAGQLAVLALPGGNIGYGHDGAGRVTSQSSPWGSLAYSYDPVGNLLTEARSSGVTTTNSYDKLGQVLSISHHTPALPRQGQATSSVARWDGSLALPGDLSKCPAGTRTITDDTSTEQVTSYLDKRTMPGTGIAGCEKTAAYTTARGLPTPGESFAAGDTLSFSYAYDRVGNVTAETEDRGSHGAVSTGFSYDDLSRLVGSSSSDGTNNTYTYDRVGNRTGWSSSAAPDTGEPLAVAASYNQAGQLVSESRSRPDGVTSVGYSYNNAGQRTQQASAGPDGASVLSYAYTAAGRMASTTQDGATSTFGYDGLGRNLTSSTDGVGSSNVWAGMAVVQQHNDNTGTATLVRDALGQVALQSATPGDISEAPAWSLQDRLGSTVAQTTPTGRITDLASYSDFGVPTFASAGFASTTGFTGELSDATTGTNTYFSRTYDPMAATWLTPDSYRGTLTDPQTQHRYGYVGGNPTTFTDAFGFKISDPGAYAVTAATKTKGGHPPPCTRRCPTVASTTPSASSDTSARHNAPCVSRGLPGTCTGVTTPEELAAAQAGVAIGVSILVGIALGACIVATAGICGVVAGAVAAGGVVAAMAAGGVVGAVTGAVGYGLMPGEKTGQGWATAVGVGFGLGAITAGIGPAIGAIVNVGKIAAPTATTAALEAASPELTTVGRWMSPAEYDAMVQSGNVQVGVGGTTYVAAPASSSAFASQAKPGSLYVEFEVPAASLRPAGTPEWAQIPSPENRLYGELASRRGEVLQSPVPACNITLVAEKC